jgi:hypothetical protein
MDVLDIQATEFSPEIKFNNESRELNISGEARPENPSTFFKPVLAWLEQYSTVLFYEKEKFGQTVPFTINFKLQYFNSTSAKFIFDMLKVVEGYIKNGVNVRVNWHYDSRDEDMKESGEEFSQMISVPIHLMPTSPRS